MGDEGKAAQLFASLVAVSPSDPTIVQRALDGAIAAGNFDLALKLARTVKPTDLPINARLLLVAQDLRARRTAEGLKRLHAAGATPDLGFLAPVIQAWDQAERGDAASLETIAQVPVAGPLGPFMAEQRALILAKLRRTSEAEPYARRAIATSGGREERVRLEMAEAFRAAGDRPRALAMLQGQGRSLSAARARLERNKPLSTLIESAPGAYAEILLGLAIGLNRADNQDLSIALAQVARFTVPRNSEAAIVLGLLLDQAGRTRDALAAFAAVPSDDLLIHQARDATVRTLARADRAPEALAIAQAAASAKDADAGDFTRLGDVLSDVDRHDDASAAYLRAVALLPADGPGSRDNWSTYLLAGAALEEAGRWPEARAMIEKGLALSPDQPLLLNFLGYAKLTHGEDIDAAEAMIRKASALRPSDSSITDSLGWALFKRGKLNEAIETLQNAAAGDPAQSEIGEHLGDALYTAGRRYEARFAWRAALVTAEESEARRINAKIDRGLEPATAAP